MRLPLVLFALLLPFAAGAQGLSSARSISDCETISNALAYNECLARFGPRLGDRPARGIAVPADGEERQTTSRIGGSGRHAVRRRGGRQSATFDVRSGRNEVGRPRASGSKRSSRRRRP